MAQLAKGLAAKSVDLSSILRPLILRENSIPLHCLLTSIHIYAVVKGRCTQNKQKIFERENRKGKARSRLGAGRPLIPALEKQRQNL